MSAGQHRQDTVGRRDGAGGEVEAVAVGLRIELEQEPVAAVERRGEFDQRAPGTHVGLARDPSPPLLPGDLRTDHKVADCKLADVDVEAGQDRPVLQRWPKLRHPDPIHPVGRDAVDVQLVGEPRAGRPVEVDLGRGQEGAAGVGDGDVPELRLAEDRTVDAADSDLETRRRLERRNPVDDEAVPRRRVEKDQGAGEDDQERDEQREQLVEEATRPVPPQARPGRRLIFDWRPSATR